MTDSLSGRIIVGLMSGTSADGIDAAVVRIEENKVELLSHRAMAYELDIRSRIFAARSDSRIRLRDLCQLCRDISLQHAVATQAAINQTGLTHADVALVAAHGQTLFHDPPLTLQLFDPAVLAQTLQIDVASDFRRADCAVGGQGAPLVPVLDRLLFAHPSETRILLNLGGIANLTLLTPQKSPASSVIAFDTIAFDTGPANCVLDHLWRRAGKAGFDESGALAISGKADEEIAVRAVRETGPFADALPPKSTDTPAMIDAFGRAGGEELPLPDALATACRMAGLMVAAGIGHLQTSAVDRLIASGGGVRNRALVVQIERTTGLTVETTDGHGIPSAAKEAVAFAWLGHLLLERRAGNLPSVTGATRPVVLGSITPGREAL